MCFAHNFYLRLVIVLVCFAILFMSVSPPDQPWSAVLQNPAAAVPTFWTHRHLSLGQWEIRLLNQGVDVWKSVIVAQIITLIPGRDGKGTGKRDGNWCHLKLHTKLERRGKTNTPNLESVACKGQGSKTSWPSKFPTLFSTEIVPLACIPLSGNLKDLSSCPLYIALGGAHRGKQESLDCCATPHVIFLYGMSPLTLK